VSSVTVTRTALRAGIGTGAVFFLAGTFLGTWASRIPALRDQTGATPTQLGQVLLVMGVGSLLSMPLTGRACTRFGARTVVLVMALVAGAALIAAGFASSVPVLAAAMFVNGFAYGSWDVAMNVHGHAAETLARRPWMPRYHALWSIGAMAGAAVGALLAGAGVSVAAHFTIVVVVSLVLLVASLTTFIDDRQVHARHAAESGTPVHRHRRSVVSRRLLAVGVVVLCGVVAEGAAADWLALLLTDERDASAATAAAGFAVFSFAMAGTRLAGPGLLAWRGRVFAVRVAGALTALGVVLTLITNVLPIAYIGAALWGLGVALIFPTCMSAAGDTPGRAADAIAFVGATGYGALLVGPPLIGFLASQVGLGVALWVVPVMGAIVVLFAPATAPPRTAREPSHPSRS
jgi:MFS family permease